MALQKNKREICEDKQILMISRFYKPAFVGMMNDSEPGFCAAFCPEQFYDWLYYKAWRRKKARLFKSVFEILSGRSAMNSSIQAKSDAKRVREQIRMEHTTGDDHMIKKGNCSKPT